MIGVQATPHDLRHYFASVQIRAGQSIKVLQALLGHKSAVETWDTYGPHGRLGRPQQVGDRGCRRKSRPQYDVGLTANLQVRGLVRMGWLIGRDKATRDWTTLATVARCL